MSQPLPTLPTSITAAFLEKIIALLAPLFITAAAGNVDAARQAVISMLVGYDARSDEELRLVALTIAFGFGALDALGRAASPDLSLNQILRLRSNATALSRAGHQNQAVLDRRRKQSAAEPAPEPEPAVQTLPASTDTADLVAFARSAIQARSHKPVATAPLSRQQRRAAERQAEKDQRRLNYQARQAALRGDLAAEPQAGPRQEPLKQSD